MATTEATESSAWSTLAAGTEFEDDHLEWFASHGARPLPAASETAEVEHDGARIWYAAYGAGPVVVLLHGGMGHGGNWGHQVPALIESGRRVVVIDSRGHGRSTRDSRLYTYELMGSDVLAVMDHLRVDSATIVGWSDGACVAMVLARHHPGRVSGVFFFGCNMDPSGTREMEMTPVVQRCFQRHVRDYATLSSTPADFAGFSDAVGEMQRTQPNYSADDLAAIQPLVTIVHAQHDEFIKREHAEYLARTIPGAEFVLLPGVSHFAPLQRPVQFNEALVDFMNKIQT